MAENQTVNPALLVALESMDVLNRWVRKTGCARPRKAVYWLKGRFAIRDAIMAGLTTRMRYVQATVKCNRCREGVYYDWDGAPRGQCYHCNGRGVAALKFVETTIAERWCWHTPLDYRSWHGWSMSDLTPEPITDWTPGREGSELAVEEAARHLNVVEAHWQQWRGKDSNAWESGRDEWDTSRYYFFNYALELDARTDETRRAGICVWCGATEELCWTCLDYPPGLTMHRAVCKRCESCRGYDWDALRALPLPDLTPELARWRDRHLAEFGERWKQRWQGPEWQLQRVLPAV